ncbi:MAG: winged helix-turn-helix domain-containing protein [Candidatus Bathyarchaeia archaeon]
MDLTIYSALISSVLLAMAIITARWALKGFRQSKQALREAASYVSVIVGALSSRIESLEEVSNQVRDAIGALSAESTGLRSSDAGLESRCRALEKSVEDMITKHNQILHELENLRSKPVPSVSEHRPVLHEDPILDRLTETERETLQILKDGPLHAPELGRRVNKSREHMARLMKRLYLEGYVDRETDRPPFRYKLNDKLRSSLGAPVSPSRPENV